MSPETVTLEDALRLLSLPRTVGEIRRRGGRRRERPLRAVREEGQGDPLARAEEQLFTITLDEALALLAEPKRSAAARAAAPPLRELGDDPVSGKPIVLKDGRFGPYVTDGETNACLRAGDTVDDDHARSGRPSLIQERRERGPTKKRTKRKS